MTATDDGFDGVSGVEDDFAPDDYGDAAPSPPDAELEARIAIAAGYDLNDDGNGRRFSLYFGDDLMSVPRVGWFNWTGSVWASDPDELEIKRKSQLVGQLVKREVFALRLSDRQMERLTREQELKDRLAVVVRDLGEDGKRTPDSEAEERVIRDEISAVGKIAAFVRRDG